MASSNDVEHYDVNAADYFMKQALSVAKAALDIGEVPVGCVIVLRDGVNDISCSDEKQGTKEYDYRSSPSVIISHGANQVNATRDATRHAEMVAIDRMLTQSQSSDHLKLPADVIQKSAHGKIPENYTSGDDHWVNVCEDKDHWKNSVGWGSGRTYDAKILSRCDLYVTCEPCIMVRTVLVQIHSSFHSQLKV